MRQPRRLATGGVIRAATRQLLLKTPIYDWLRRQRQPLELRAWERSGRSSTPPPIFKQRVVREYAEKFSLPILVETGTFFGDMVFASKKCFATIFSIELDEWLYERAQKRFAGDSHIHIVLGDSNEILSRILPKIDRPCLFWLDAHAMFGDARGPRITPISRELRDICASSLEEYVILIDDARLFTGMAGYPTLDDLRSMVLARHPDWIFEVEHDIIRAHPVLGQELDCTDPTRRRRSPEAVSRQSDVC